MMEISWEPPAPRTGRHSWWEAAIGPGATPAEVRLQLGAGLVLAALFLGISLRQAQAAWSGPQIALLALLAVDLSGGVLTNATSAAKRWYHRPGQGARQHLAFVLPHGVHLGLLAWLFPELGWPYALPCFLYLVAASIGVLLAPLYLQRPVALAAYAGALALNVALAPPAALAWIAPLFFLKLLVAHLLREAPFAPDGAATAQAGDRQSMER